MLAVFAVLFDVRSPHRVYSLFCGIVARLLSPFFLFGLEDVAFVGLLIPVFHGFVAAAHPQSVVNLSILKELCFPHFMNWLGRLQTRAAHPKNNFRLNFSETVLGGWFKILGIFHILIQTAQLSSKFVKGRLVLKMRFFQFRELFLVSLELASILGCLFH